MTIIDYSWCGAAGLLGVACFIFFVKIPHMQEQAKVSNLPFSYKDYFCCDATAIISSILTVVACMLLVNEWIGDRPMILKYVRTFFLFIGYTGSSFLVSVLGKAQKQVNNVIDIKTNIADNKQN